MTTITIETEGQAPIVIALGGAPSLDQGHFGNKDHPNAYPGEPYSPPAPVLAERSPPEGRPGWRKRLRDAAPGVALGLVAALVIVGSRPAAIPGAVGQDAISDGSIPQQPLLPPLPGGPIGAASPSGWNGSGAVDRPRSVNQTIQDSQRLMTTGNSPYAAGGARAAAPRENSGGAPTADVAPTISGAPTVGAAGKPGGAFGLEP
ncbi:hypothetical protein AA23498_2696 [Acetobacter nitrogenifigens DSM 23921 = NBRC 105050]|uniref:Uncharacterized protein n=1 Tax=Acetobacter nitrogenifigens DSM 23921 = NBRC 105050 TaxID=1120919 RepID=A0A511XEV4_9PROT|nr:hypothetical protein [Acetobacter nitrogenifigens]GBQ96654.1 hypothetical protein AA23498_2696 [Acetobacter nitrogenifigens DSM 23921 = NBRC 105050]GEN61477.1 hypothetical protein ANI02nite_33610 [Acetobacter nitrogenifigens DSM 23921 = NBRC 105050]